MLNSKSISMRLVEESDAEFILSLRLDKKYNQFLSKVGTDLDAQKAWIKQYKLEEELDKQFYFIITNNNGKPCGTLRVYDFKGDSFCWGSWILNENKTRFAAIESALMVYTFGFDKLGYEKCHFDVMKGNNKVISFHKKFGAKITAEDEKNYYFNLSKDDVNNVRPSLEKLL